MNFFLINLLNNLYTKLKGNTAKGLREEILREILICAYYINDLDIGSANADQFGQYMKLPEDIDKKIFDFYTEKKEQGGDHISMLEILEEKFYDLFIIEKEKGKLTQLIDLLQELIQEDVKEDNKKWVDDFRSPLKYLLENLTNKVYKETKDIEKLQVVQKEVIVSALSVLREAPSEKAASKGAGVVSEKLVAKGAGVVAEKAVAKGAGVVAEKSEAKGAGVEKAAEKGAPGFSAAYLANENSKFEKNLRILTDELKQEQKDHNMYFFEKKHDFIQFFFPTEEESRYVEHAKGITLEEKNYIKQSRECQKNIEQAMNMYVEYLEKKPDLVWGKPHNYQRISRIISSLALTATDDELGRKRQKVFIKKMLGSLKSYSGDIHEKRFYSTLNKSISYWCFAAGLKGKPNITTEDDLKNLSSFAGIQEYELLGLTQVKNVASIPPSRVVKPPSAVSGREAEEATKQASITPAVVSGREAEEAIKQASITSEVSGREAEKATKQASIPPSVSGREAQVSVKTLKSEVSGIDEKKVSTSEELSELEKVQLKEAIEESMKDIQRKEQHQIHEDRILALRLASEESRWTPPIESDKYIELLGRINTTLKEELINFRPPPGIEEQKIMLDILIRQSPSFQGDGIEVGSGEEELLSSGRGMAKGSMALAQGLSLSSLSQEAKSAGAGLAERYIPPDGSCSLHCIVCMLFMIDKRAEGIEDFLSVTKFMEEVEKNLLPNFGTEDFKNFKERFNFVMNLPLAEQEKVYKEVIEKDPQYFEIMKCMLDLIIQDPAKVSNPDIYNSITRLESLYSIVKKNNCLIVPQEEFWLETVDIGTILSFKLGIDYAPDTFSERLKYLGLGIDFPTQDHQHFSCLVEIDERCTLDEFQINTLQLGKYEDIATKIVEHEINQRLDESYKSYKREVVELTVEPVVNSMKANNFFDFNEISSIIGLKIDQVIEDMKVRKSLDRSRLAKVSKHFEKSIGVGNSGQSKLDQKRKKKVRRRASQTKVSQTKNERKKPVGGESNQSKSDQKRKKKARRKKGGCRSNIL